MGRTDPTRSTSSPVHVRSICSDFCISARASAGWQAKLPFVSYQVRPFTGEIDIDLTLNRAHLPLPITPASTMPVAGREPRPKYTPEQCFYIWYLYKDVDLDWAATVRAFNSMFGRPLRNKGGLQCKFYRTLEEFGVPKVRQQGRSASEGSTARYGVLERTNYRNKDWSK